MTDPPIRLLLVDDHVAFRIPIAFMLDREPDLTVVAQAGTLDEARRAVRDPGGPIDVALVDLDLPDGSGIEIVRDLRTHNPHAQIALLTASEDARDHARAVEAGAVGILLKSASVQEIVDAIRRLFAGETLLSARSTIDLLRIAGQQRYRDEANRSIFERLTPREREVLQALADGLSDKDIAVRLGVSAKTVRAHMVNLLGKLDVDSRLQAVILAVRHGAVALG